MSWTVIRSGSCWIHPETASLVTSIISKSPLGCLWLNYFWCHAAILRCSDCTDAVCFVLKNLEFVAWVGYETHSENVEIYVFALHCCHVTSEVFCGVLCVQSLFPWNYNFCKNSVLILKLPDFVASTAVFRILFFVKKANIYWRKKNTNLIIELGVLLAFKGCCSKELLLLGLWAQFSIFSVFDQNGQC